MIDNIILLITGTLHQRQIAELRSKCHPLGNFDEMESVNIANTPAELYEAVLVDTPLGNSFRLFLWMHHLAGKIVVNTELWPDGLKHSVFETLCIVLGHWVGALKYYFYDYENEHYETVFLLQAPYFKSCISQTDLDELHIELIRNALYKVVQSWHLGVFNLKTSIVLGILGRFLPVLQRSG